MALAARKVQNIPEPLQARTDDGFAASFDHPRAKEESSTPKLRIAHAAGVGGEIVDFFQDVLCQAWMGVGMLRGNFAEARRERFNMEQGGNLP